MVAVGTTVVRALETAATAAPRDPDPGSVGPRTGRVAEGEEAGGRLSAALLRPGPGVSRLRIAPGHRLRVVDGLLTGLHEPEASHLDLLAAFLDRAALARAYAAALASGYLWHEFGDVCLLLPSAQGPGSAELPA